MCDSGDAYLPFNIYPAIFSHAAMDNIYINEDTRSGQGTTHVLDSLIYLGRFGEGIPKVHIPKESKDIRRKSLKHLIWNTHIFFTGQIKVKDLWT